MNLVLTSKIGGPTMKGVRQAFDTTAIESIVAHRQVSSVYQPIVDLFTREVVGYEALARGPKGSALESPVALFAAAQQAGLSAALDWECRAAALRGAIEGGLGQGTCLFVNLEASSFRAPMPPHLSAEIESSVGQLSVVAEITERDLGTDPASLFHFVRELRSRGLRIAIDDLGVAADSLALLPFLAPEVIKLDMSLTQNGHTAIAAATSAAVRADAERRRAMVIAEGIEREEHLDRALVLGATHGQGWLFGRPGPIEAASRPERRTSAIWSRLPASSQVAPITPWTLVEGSPRIQTAPKRLPVPMSTTIEQHPIPAYEQPVVLGAFQHARNFTPATAVRYRSLAQKAALVAALGEDMAPAPAVGVRGGTVAADHPLVGEWTVVAIGPHYAAALIARDRGDLGPESERRFDYVITHDRDTVIAAARSLLRLVEPA